jgi:hypothetical protein
MRVTYGAGDFPIPTDGAPQRLLVDLGLTGRLSVGVWVGSLRPLAQLAFGFRFSFSDLS